MAGAISQALERVVFVAGDIVVQQGNVADAMYFISAGMHVVRVVTASLVMLLLISLSLPFVELRKFGWR